MSDQIHIKGLELPTIIGVPKEERQLPQTVAINASLTLSQSIEGIDDNIEKTADYYTITQKMREVAASGERKLIETLAEDLAEAILVFESVSCVQIEVEKFILPGCGAVSIEIERS